MGENEQQEKWDFSSYIRETEAKNRRDFDIIIHYWETKKVQFPSKAVANSNLTRSLKAAKLLRDYPDEKITATMDWLDKNADFPWKLETVLKYIDEDLTKLKQKNVKAF